MNVPATELPETVRVYPPVCTSGPHGANGANCAATPADKASSVTSMAVTINPFLNCIIHPLLVIGRPIYKTLF
jgi:hypothetical protein